MARPPGYRSRRLCASARSAKYTPSAPSSLAIAPLVPSQQHLAANTDPTPVEQAAETVEVPPEELARRSLALALHGAGWGVLCRPEDPKPRPLELTGWFGFLVLLALIGIPVRNVSEMLGLPLWVAGLLGIGVLLAVAIAGMEGAKPERTIQVLVGALIASCVVRGLVEHWSPVIGMLWKVSAATFALSVLPRLVQTLRRIDLVGLVRSVPLVFPLTLLFIFVPIFTPEFWEAAASLNGWRFGGLGFLLGGPLLLVVAHRLLVRSEPAIVQAAQTHEDVPDTVEGTLRQVRKRVGRAEASELDVRGRATLLRGFESPFPSEQGPILAVIAGATFRRKTLAGYLPTVLGIGALLFSYVYVIASIAIPVQLAREWSHHAVSLHHIWFVRAPGGPYVAVAALLAIFAGAAFLALVLTEERFSTVLDDALLRQPATEMVTLALPYLALSESGA